ncbi:hypothetical protein D3C71_1329060 [compost metagenome]
MDAVVDIAMHEVERLLKDNDYSVSVIAQETYSTSSFYLHRMFKRHMGVTTE